MPDRAPTAAVRPFARSSVRSNAPLLERCARAVAKASGFDYSGASIIAAARTNPRAAQFVAVAKAVLNEAGATRT